MFKNNACRALQDGDRWGHLHREMGLNISFTEVVDFRPDRRTPLSPMPPKAFEPTLGTKNVTHSDTGPSLGAKM